MKHINWMAPVLLAAALAGCGGGSDPVPIAAADAVPDTANAGDGGMTAWILALAREDAEGKEALDLAKFMPQSAENTEPQEIE